MHTKFQSQSKRWGYKHCRALECLDFPTKNSESHPMWEERTDKFVVWRGTFHAERLYDKNQKLQTRVGLQRQLHEIDKRNIDAQS